MKTYKQLLEWLNGLTEEQLNCNISVVTYHSEINILDDGSYSDNVAFGVETEDNVIGINEPYISVVVD